MIDKIKQSVAPLLIGGVVGMIMLSQLFGFMSKGTAQDLAEVAVEEAIVAAFVPTCIANGQADQTLLAAVMAESTYRRRGAVSDAEWATYPPDANMSLKRTIDQACVDGLES